MVHKAYLSRVMKDTMYPSEKFNTAELEEIFNHLFAASENTVLIGGASEPLYVPAHTGQAKNHIYYVSDSFASALHEVAHWLVAGPARRRHVDYGYWYEPDGRSIPQQQQFEAVEVNNQSVEWLLAIACGMRFHASFDNLNNPQAQIDPFLDRLSHRLWQRLRSPLPRRCALLIAALQQHYQQEHNFLMFSKEFSQAPFRPHH